LRSGKILSLPKAVCVDQLVPEKPLALVPCFFCIKNHEVMGLILKDVIFIDHETLDFKATNLLVNEGENGSIEFFTDISLIPLKNFYEIIDCRGKYVTKSFAVGHHHIYSALARGMSAPPKQPSNFREILEFIWWRLDKVLDAEMIRASAMAAALDCVRCGCTFIIDHHASPSAISGSLSIIADVFEEIGIGHLLCYEITDRDGSDKTEEGLEETASYLAKRQGLVGLHASFTVSEKTMKTAAGLCQKFNTGVHIHVAEDLYDQHHCHENYKKRVVERLDEYGFTNLSKSLFIHCLHLSEKEREIITKGRLWVVENIESNMNNNVGYFDGNGLGNRILYGTDGMHGNMIRSAQSAFFGGRRFGNPGFDETYTNFRNVHRYLKQNNFAGDGENNLVILDYPSPTPFNTQNFYGHFIYGWDAGFVSDVIANGRFVYKNRQFTTINEDEWRNFAIEQTRRLWEKMK